MHHAIFLVAKALQQNLPVSIRASFGFSSINFIECSTALRMTVGLEEKTQIDQVADIIIKQCKLAQNFCQYDPEEDYLIENVLNNEKLLLAEVLEKNNIRVIEYAKKHSLKEFVHFICFLIFQEIENNKSSQENESN